MGGMGTFQSSPVPRYPTRAKSHRHLGTDASALTIRHQYIAKFSAFDGCLGGHVLIKRVSTVATPVKPENY